MGLCSCCQATGRGTAWLCAEQSSIGAATLALTCQSAPRVSRHQGVQTPSARFFKPLERLPDQHHFIQRMNEGHDGDFLSWMVDLWAFGHLMPKWWFS